MIKTRLKQALLAIVLLVATFGAGTWYGHSLPKSGVDPQDYIETVFTPYADGEAKLISFLDRAKHKVRIASYSFTEPDITDKLIELKGRGVDVKVLVDKSQSVTGGRSGSSAQRLAIERMRAAGIEVVVGTSEKRGQIMHLKITVIDDEWVEDGSWNYSKSANYQANNLNFIQSVKRAALFTDNWNQMYRFMKTQDQTPWDKTD